MASPKAHLYRFKDIVPVPNARQLTDIILSKTNRKTPTVVHPQYAISRIRGFYMRKVKFCQTAFSEKLGNILEQFPRLDDIHPFYSDLCNVLYDRDHYKLALGQLNAIKGVVDRVAKDYVRLLKYSDSAYKCKLLKKAALGRMVSATKRANASLTYLEEVRQHLSRLPSINPTTRTLIVCGYPNVGKSSFMNIVTRANVEVQPFAFTTKSLYVGHFDYAYVRWQVIDTPGVLDRPVEERNTIEMTAITALVHIHAAVLYFVDLSESCGFSLEAQVKLFHSIKAVFKNKPVLVVCNKSDVRAPNDLSDEEKQLIKSMCDGMPSLEFVATSCVSFDGVDVCKNRACELLMKSRLERKLGTKAGEDALKRLTVTSTKLSNERPPFIPSSVVEKKLQEQSGVEVEKFATEKELQEAGGGAGVYNPDLRKHVLLEKDEWRYDAVPEIFGGKNIKDFIDPDVEQKLAALLEEEKELATGGMTEIDWEEYIRLTNLLHDTHKLRRMKEKLHRSKLSRNHSRVVTKRIHADQVEEKLVELGHDPDPVLERAKPRARAAKILGLGKRMPIIDTTECGYMEKWKRDPNYDPMNHPSDGEWESDDAVEDEEPIREFDDSGKPLSEFEMSQALVLQSRAKKEKGVREKQEVLFADVLAMEKFKSETVKEREARVADARRRLLRFIRPSPTKFKPGFVWRRTLKSSRLSMSISKKFRHKAEKLVKSVAKSRAKLGLVNEGDRWHPDLKPKHLNSGKASFKRQRR